MVFVMETFRRLLACETSLEIQFLEALVIAVTLGLAFPPLQRASLCFFKSRPWYGFTSALMKDMMEKMLGIDMDEQFLSKMMGSMLTIPGQHMLGGLLCVPAILGCGVSRETALCLARHGALIELGWEIQDTAERLWDRFATPDGAKRNPWAMFRVMLIHHGMQWALVIPMNLHYSHLSGYHELIFMLEGAAGFAGLAGFYGYTCDTSKRSELQQLILWNALNFIIMIYTRFVHYWWSVYKCLHFFWQAGAYPELVAGIVCGLGLMPYVGALFIPEQWHKLRKFVTLYMEPEQRPTGLTTLLESKAPASKGKVHAE